MLLAQEAGKQVVPHSLFFAAIRFARGKGIAIEQPVLFWLDEVEKEKLWKS